MKDIAPEIKLTGADKVLLAIIVSACALITIVGVAGIAGYITQRWFS